MSWKSGLKRAPIECCLDADWLSDLQFVTSGSDARIYIMDLDSPKPLRTLL